VAGNTSQLTRRRPATVAGLDLDVTPVMNMFIILIPFLVGMAAFTHLAVQDVELASDQGSPPALTTAAAQPLVVAVGDRGLVIVRDAAVLAELPAKNGAQDLDGLLAVLSDLEASRLVLAVDDPVSVDTVVACLDCCRAAGFADVGLASGMGVVMTGEAQP